MMVGTRLAILSVLILLLGMAPRAEAAGASRDVLYQVSTLDALVGGVYEGTTTVAQLKRWGDFGIGTFNRVDGEMVLYKGQCYQARFDGRAVRAPKTALSPFASVTHFEPDLTISIDQEMDFAAVRAFLDSKLPSPNLFYAVCIEGEFSYVKARALPPQQPPYGNLAAATAKQPTFEFQGVNGVLIGFRSPSFVNGVAFPGYHLHFLDEAKEHGGHMLEFRVKKATVTLDITPGFQLQLPTQGAFTAIDLAKDRKEDVNKVEKSR